MKMRDFLLQATENFAVSLNENQLNQLEIYYDLLVEWNQKINLTAITDPQGVAVKHFADSLAVLNYIDIEQGASVIDVGTGAGFPGVVLKIARPDINLCLLDSLNKRLVFLQEVLDNIGLDAQLVHSRAEDGAHNKNLREKFDYAVSRAVAQLNVLSEYCLGYVKVGGTFAALKGPNSAAEIENAASALALCGGNLAKNYEFSLPLDGGERSILKIDKIKKMPDRLPRPSGKIKAKSL